MELREQKYVCTLAECHSLSRAAEKLHITQPALSIYIANLEKNTGVPLFDRTGKKFALTYAGEKYVETARKMLELEREYNEEILDIVHKNAGRLVLGVPLRRGSWLIPPAVRRFEEKWPGVRLDIREGNQKDMELMLKDLELDIAILTEDSVPDPNLETRLLFEEKFLIAVSSLDPVNSLAVRKPGDRYARISPSALNGKTLILQNTIQSSRCLEDRIIRNNNILPERIRIIRSIETSMQMAAEGLGICFIRESYAVNMNYIKPVNYYMLDDADHEQKVFAVCHAGIHPAAYLEDMIDILEEQGKLLLQTNQRSAAE